MILCFVDIFNMKEDKLENSSTLKVGKMSDILNPVCIEVLGFPILAGFEECWEHKGMACFYTCVNKICILSTENTQAVLLWLTRGFPSGL